MGKRGPAKTPSAIRKARGNPGHQKLTDNEPSPEADRIAPPDWLSKRGRKTWDDHAKDLQAQGVLTNNDVAHFAMWCEYIAQFAEASDHIKGTNIVDGVHVSVYVKARRDAADMAHRLGQQFGMTPSARTGISVVKPKEKSDLAAFLAESPNVLSFPKQAKSKGKK